MTAHRWKGFAIAIAIAGVAPPLLGRAGVLTNYRSDVLVTGLVFMAAALSLNLLMGYAGQISLGHYGLVGVGAFTAGLLTSADRAALPFVVGILAAAGVTALVAFLIGLPALRLRGVYLAVATMGFAFAAKEWLFRMPGISGGSAGLEVPRPLFGSFELTSDADYLAVVLVVVVLMWLVDSNVTSSKLGRAFQAIRADEAVAASFGVDVTRSKLLAFTISGAFAGLAGALFAHQTTLIQADTFPFERSLLIVILVVIGGLGSRVGVAIASMFFAIFPLVFIEVLGNAWQGIDLIVGAALLLFTISQHPGGLAEALHEAREKKAARATTADAPEASLATIPDLPRPQGIPARAREPEGSALLAARGIGVSFGGLRAVDDVSLDVHRGRIVGLIGPNGAGKTTMFNALSGALRAQTGTVHLLGQDVTDAPAHVRARLGLGRSFQLIGLAPDLSVTENLLLAQHQVAAYGTTSALIGLGRAPRIERELRERARDAVMTLGFERYADTPVKNLSHGQQRIVEIGCVLVTAPELVMLDEPSAGMAPGAVEHLAARLREMRDELGRTLLLIEHNIPLVLDVCDELYVMNSGQLLAHGPPDEVVSSEAVVAAYLGGEVKV